MFNRKLVEPIKLTDDIMSLIELRQSKILAENLVDDDKNVRIATKNLNKFIAKKYSGGGVFLSSNLLIGGWFSPSIDVLKRIESNFRKAGWNVYIYSGQLYLNGKL